MNQPHFSPATRNALLVGTDEMLLYTRKAILEQEGFDVVIADPANALNSVKTSDLSVVVACHTLNLPEADALVQAARSNPAQPVLIAFSRNVVPQPTDHPFDGSVWSLAVPEVFISKVHELLRTRVR